jgi:class 3 adenylate cyclase/tetratricopeptide (TPR) repeat protein
MRNQAESARLAAYVPRLVLDWLRTSPEAMHRTVDGTLVLVDISGFTTLTERLARRGRVGAEELTETLNRCFTGLLTVAYEDGAGLVKWGGDAMLLLFTGDEHPSHACRAAARMQQNLSSLGRLRTSSGTVQLGMSIGIHTDLFDFFLVGDLHRDLVIAGPAATTTVEMEVSAGAGEVVLSPTTAQRVEADLVAATPADGGGFLLTGIPDAAYDPTPDIGPVSDLDLAHCLPPAIAAHVLAAHDEGEHRAVAIAFVEFSRTDELMHTSGPDSVARALHERITSVQRIAIRYGIPFFQTDISRGGGKIILIAGAPTSGRDAEERILRAVRDIVDDAGALPLRVGVNSGRVFAGTFGPPYRRTYAVYGDAVNTAARLMAVARLGQIVASARAIERAKTTFAEDELDPLTLKGKRDLVLASVVGRREGPRQSTVASLPLVGREQELNAMIASLRAAREGDGGLIELVGEPGSGKSRLVEELRRHAASMPAFAVAAEEYGAATAYSVLASLLRQVLEIDPDVSSASAAARLRERVMKVAPDLLDWLPLVGVVLGIEIPATEVTRDLDEKFIQIRLHETIVRLLAALVPTAALFTFEDIHWIDDASRELLRAMVTELEQRPWLLVVTRRPDSTSFSTATPNTLSITVEPLAPSAAQALIRASTDHLSLQPHQLSAIAERAGGNPLFLTELVAAMHADGGTAEVLPDSLEALLNAQIDQLAPRDRTVLRYAATLGNRFDLGVLIESLPAEDASFDTHVWSRLEAFIQPDQPGTFRFRHALVRDAAYEGLPFRRRRALHARVAETIERLGRESGEEQTELLSLHFFHAHRFREAWHYSRVAADHARAAYAHAEAAMLYERALQAARHVRSTLPLEVAKVAEALGDMRLRLGELERAAAAYRTSRGRVDGDAVRGASLLLKEGLIRWRLGRYPQSLRWIKRGMSALEGLEDDEAVATRARLAAWYAVVRQKQGRASEAITWCSRAIDEAERSGARDAFAHAYYILDWAYVALGQPERAVYSGDALAIYEELGDLERQAGVLNNLGVWAYFAGRWEESLDFYDRARRAWERIGDLWSASFATSNVAEILSDQGHLDEAEPLLRDALRIWRASGADSFIASATRELAKLEARRGRFDEAFLLFEEARARYVEHRDHAEVIATDARIAESLVGAGRAEDALRLATGALEDSRAQEAVFALVPTLCRIRGSALAALGRETEARRELDAALHAARERQADYEIGLILEALVQIMAAGETREAKALAAQRDAIFERLGVELRRPEGVGLMSSQVAAPTAAIVRT